MYVSKLSLHGDVGVNGVGRRHVKSRECMLLYRLTQLLYESKDSERRTTVGRRNDSEQCSRMVLVLVSKKGLKNHPLGRSRLL